MKMYGGVEVPRILTLGLYRNKITASHQSHYTSIPPYVFMVWCLIKHKDNFIFTFKNGHFSSSHPKKMLGVLFVRQWLNVSFDLSSRVTCSSTCSLFGMLNYSELCVSAFKVVLLCQRILTEWEREQSGPATECFLVRVCMCNSEGINGTIYFSNNLSIYNGSLLFFVYDMSLYSYMSHRHEVTCINCWLNEILTFENEMCLCHGLRHF
jgi:hypothetical protein